MNKTFLFVLISGVCGGSVFPLIKIAESYAIPRFSYIFWESLLVILFLTFGSLCQKQLSLPKKSELKYYLFCAVTNILLPQSLFFFVAANVQATFISLITSLTPLFVYLCLVLFVGEKVARSKVLGLLAGFLGVAMLFVPSITSETASTSLTWLLFSLSLPIVYTVNRIFVTRLQPEKASPYRLAIGLFCVVCFASGIAMIFLEGIYVPFTDFNSGDMALLFHAFLMATFYIFFFIISKEGAVQNALTFYLAPLVGTGWGVFLFKEDVGVFFTLSAILIFFALYLINRKTST